MREIPPAPSIDPTAPRVQWQAGGEGAARWIELGDDAMSPQVFWGRYLEQLGGRLKARRIVLFAASVGEPWRPLAQWPAQARALPEDVPRVQEALAALSEDQPLIGDHAEGPGLLAMRLPQAPAAPDQVVAVVALRTEPFGAASAAWLAWAGMAASLPAWYARLATARALRAIATPGGGASGSGPEAALTTTLASGGATQDRSGEAGALRSGPAAILDLAGRLWRHTHFQRMLFDLCGQLAQGWQCERVSVAWRDGHYLKLQAISDVEKFDAKSAMVRALETAMEEAADQPGDLHHPLPEGARQVDRAHAAYARMQGTGHLLSVPVHRGSAVVGVITLERNARAFDAMERTDLTALAQVAGPAMALLQERHRSMRERLKAGAIELRAALAGPRHSVAKLSAALAVILLLVLVLVPWSYRVESTLLVRSRDVLFMPAPFDGFLSRVEVEVGDAVKAGQPLASLDTRELTLESSMMQADWMRFGREAEKAQAARQLAEMQITLARQQQSAARLSLIDHQLTQAQLVAPFDGVVVEGDLKKSLGAPLRRGDLMLKLARAGDIVLEISIDEVDIHEVGPGSRGELALVGRPDQKFPFVIDRIDPVAALKDGRNVYVARARHEGPTPDWWRPGMGGSARIEAGDRSLLWVLTHRTVRFLRQVFWL